jgi:hypothetical protein
MNHTISSTEPHAEISAPRLRVGPAQQEAGHHQDQERQQGQSGGDAADVVPLLSDDLCPEGLIEPAGTAGRCAHPQLPGTPA